MGSIPWQMLRELQRVSALLHAKVRPPEQHSLHARSSPRPASTVYCRTLCTGHGKQGAAPEGALVALDQVALEPGVEGAVLAAATLGRRAERCQRRGCIFRALVSGSLEKLNRPASVAVGMACPRTVGAACMMPSGQACWRALCCLSQRLAAAGMAGSCFVGPSGCLCRRSGCLARVWNPV